jgi:arylsulfatase A-like enzyme
MQPNVVFLLLDTARADHLSCYGYDRETTPFVDSLAESGVRYERAFANSIWSLPSYGSIFTGEYPTHHGAVDWSQHVEENVLVEGLSDAGYATHAVSTHLVSDQFGIGGAFDEVDWMPADSRDRIFEDDPVAEAMAEKGTKDGWTSEREKYTYFLRTLARNPSPKSVLNGGYQFWQKLKKDRGWWDDDGASDALDRARTVVDGFSEPFFLFVNFVETHDPYRPPRNYIRRFLPDDVSLGEVTDALDYSSVRATLGLDDITDRQREILVALYDAELAYLDDQIREFHQYLETEGLAEDTVFVVVSDHGDFFGEHGLWGHQGRVYTQACHVPLVIDYPWSSGTVEPGVTELRQLCDHLLEVARGDQTVLDASGEALVEYYGLDTQLSFAPWETYAGIDERRWASYQSALVTGGDKLLWDAAGTAELYNLASDFGGSTDIAEGTPDRVAALQERIEQLVGTPPDNHERYRSERGGADPTLGGEASSEMQDRLRELGYLE